MYTPDRFEFTTDAQAPRADVVISERIANREQLFHAIAKGLDFPDYFGENWDALIDCLSDLSWLDRDEVVVDHAALPSLEPRKLRIYLESLVDAISRRAPSDRPRLKLTFRKNDKQTIEGLFAEDA